MKAQLSKPIVKTHLPGLKTKLEVTGWSLLISLVTTGILWGIQAGAKPAIQWMLLIATIGYFIALVVVAIARKRKLGQAFKSTKQFFKALVVVVLKAFGFVFSFYIIVALIATGGHPMLAEINGRWTIDAIVLAWYGIGYIIWNLILVLCTNT